MNGADEAPGAPDTPAPAPDDPRVDPADAAGTDRPGVRATDSTDGTRDGTSGDGGAEGTGTTARPENRARNGLLGLLRETVIVVGTALVLSLVIKTFLVQAFYIPSESMERTLLVGDRVLVSQLTPGPFDLERGDVVVFKDPGGWLPEIPAPERGPVSSAVVSVLTFVGVLPQDAGEHLIKRIIGLPGDHVVCCDGQGRITVNGVPVAETYLAPGAVPSERPFDLVVPPGRLWVLGDNRQNSRDSRWHTDLPDGGTVAEDLVVGTAFATIWPLDRWSRLSTEGDVFDAVPPPPATAGQ